MAARRADFPDAFVGLLPAGLEELEELELDAPGGILGLRHRLELRRARQVQRVHDFAVDVELELFDRRIAHAHRDGTAVPGPPGPLVLGHAPLA
jgi:hypothetical protein